MSKGNFCDICFVIFVFFKINHSFALYIQPLNAVQVLFLSVASGWAASFWQEKSCWAVSQKQ